MERMDMRGIQYIIDINNTDTNKNMIASYLHLYLNENMLFAQLIFVNEYINILFDPHF